MSQFVLITALDQGECVNLSAIKDAIVRDARSLLVKPVDLVDKAFVLYVIRLRIIIKRYCLFLYLFQERVVLFLSNLIMVGTISSTLAFSSKYTI